MNSRIHGGCIARIMKKNLSFLHNIFFKEIH
jgi:hypothetical protein